jgi:pentatricopeptide repeat protein
VKACVHAVNKNTIPQTLTFFKHESHVIDQRVTIKCSVVTPALPKCAGHNSRYVTSYNTLMSARVATKDTVKCAETMQEMRAAGVVPALLLRSSAVPYCPGCHASLIPSWPHP